MSAVTQRLVIQFSEYGHFCIFRLVRAYQNKNTKMYCYFWILQFIIFSMIHSLPRFSLKQHVKRAFSGRHPWRSTVTLNFWLACDQVVHLETMANVCQSASSNKTLNDWPYGKLWVLLPLDPQCFPRLHLREHWGTQETKLTVSWVPQCFSSPFSDIYILSKLIHLPSRIK